LAVRFLLSSQISPYRYLGLISSSTAAYWRFYSIPKELEEAAFVNGADRFWVYWHVCLPLVRGAIVTQGIFTFLGAWNDLFWPLIVLSDRLNLTLPVGLLILLQATCVQRAACPWRAR
jgi:multiple sugar transport system permease protein